MVRGKKRFDRGEGKRTEENNVMAETGPRPERLRKKRKKKARPPTISRNPRGGGPWSETGLG